MPHGFFPNGRQRLRNLVESVTRWSYPALFLLWVGLAASFGLAYFLLSYAPGIHGPTELQGMTILRRLLNSFYYSVITATSTGYGDIVPQGFSKVLASFQSLLALFVFAVFVTKLVSHRYEIALQQVHKLSFEDMFHNIREGFYIVRKDFDRLIERVSTLHQLSAQDWVDLTTAYRQAQSYLRRLPDFYDGQNRLYTIDARREELLQEGVQRTLQRLLHLLQILSTKHIAWTEQNECVEELREFIQMVRMITQEWRAQSPHHRMEAFEQIQDLSERIQQMIEATVLRSDHRHSHA
jgi:hypothetical protein